ncbi:MAG: hypothetical protein ACRYHQ_37310, partial [Janthinobacterium lividum]
MIIQLPRDTTSIVLRFDGADFDGSDPQQTITLLSGREPAPAAVASTLSRLSLPALGVRRRTMLVCSAVGMLVAGIGVSILQSPRAEPALFQPRPTAWNDSPPGVPQQIPERVRAELEHGPTVMPPDAGPM